MNKRRRHRQDHRGTGARPRPPVPRDHARSGRTLVAQAFADVRDALRDHPLALLEFVSLVLAMNPQRELVPAPAGITLQSRSLDDLVGSLLDHGSTESSALLAVIAQMGDDGDVRAHIGRELALGMPTLPEWISRLDEIEVHRTTEQSRSPGEGTAVIVETRLVTGEALSITVTIDLDAEACLCDAFAVPVSVDQLIANVRMVTDDDPEFRWNDIPGADARARIEHAIAAADATHLHLVTETWPSCRPLVEWVTRMLPDGAHGSEGPEPSNEWY
jgi:hypothetical protein